MNSTITNTGAHSPCASPIINRIWLCLGLRSTCPKSLLAPNFVMLNNIQTYYKTFIASVSSHQGLKTRYLHNVSLLSSHQGIKNGIHWLFIALVSSHHALKNEINFIHCFFHFIFLLDLVKIPVTYVNNEFPTNLHSGFWQLEDYRWLVGIFSPTACCHWSPGSHDGEQWKGFPPKRRTGSCLACVYRRYIVRILESTREATATISYEQVKLLNLV